VAFQDVVIGLITDAVHSVVVGLSDRLGRNERQKNKIEKTIEWVLLGGLILCIIVITFAYSR